MPAAWPRAAYLPVAEGPGRRHRQECQHHHHRPAMTIGNVITALNTAMGGAATFTLNARRLDLHRHQSRFIPAISSTSPTTPPSAAPPASASPSCSGWATTQAPTRPIGFQLDPRGRANPASARLCQPGHHAGQRGRRHDCAGRRQFRRHRAAERHHQAAEFSRRRRHRRPDLLAVGLCRDLLSESFHPIERHHRQPDHPGRPADGSQSARLLQFRRQSGRRADRT